MAIVRHAPRGMLIASAALLSLGGGCGDEVTQPIQFSHKKHAKEMDCTDCHRYPETQTFSGLPTIDDCMGCHEEAQTKSPEEEKIRSTAKAGGQLVWNRLFHVPDHVYYSHRRHVVLGKLKCPTCHGQIGQTERPPPSVTNLTMDFCIDCHTQRRVTVDCVACHR